MVHEHVQIYAQMLAFGTRQKQTYHQYFLKILKFAVYYQSMMTSLQFG